MAGSRVEFLEPWKGFGEEQADALLFELSSEVSPGHALWDVELEPIGQSGAADDVLFATRDGRVVEVHLTWSCRAEQPPWPVHRFYSSLEEWIQQVMEPEHIEFRNSKDCL